MQKMSEKEATEMLKAKLICMKLEALSCIEKGCDKDCDNCQYNYTQGTIGEQEEALEVAIQALEEIQKYRAIENELKEKYNANVDISGLIKYFIETIFKGDKHEGFCILTNEDAKMWDEYQAIGTLEECREAVERMKPIYIFGSDYNWTCSACGTFHSTKGKYCSECGHKIELY